MGAKFPNFGKCFTKTDFFSLLANGLDFEEQLGHKCRSNLGGMDTLAWDVRPHFPYLTQYVSKVPKEEMLPTLIGVPLNV